jgi:DNA-binding NtrC family response regulator
MATDEHQIEMREDGGCPKMRKDGCVVYKARVMVVDDLQEMCAYLCDALARAGYETVAAHSGQEALDEISRQRVDLVLADIKMPGMSGLEMLRRVKAIDPSLVVIVMTAYSFIGYAIEAVRFGAHDYLTKPFGSRELLSAIERGLQVAEAPG